GARGLAARNGTLAAAGADAQPPARLAGPSRPPQRRAQPAAQQRGLRPRAADADLLLADSRPVRGETEPPVAGPRPCDVRDRSPTEGLRELGVAQLLPLRRVDDDPIGEARELLPLHTREVGLTAPAQEHRQV